MNSIEIAKKFKEEKKKELSDRKVQVKIEKGKVLNRERTERLIKKQKSKVSSLKISQNKARKVKSGQSIGKKKYIYKRKNTEEKELFDEIRNERQHICSICSKFIQEPLSWCFAHLLAKGQYKEYRLNKNNIAIVCSIECHHKIDSAIVGSKSYIKDMIDKGHHLDFIIDSLGKRQKQEMVELGLNELFGLG